MNKTQKFIGGVAAVMFSATLVFAPWEKAYPAQPARRSGFNGGIFELDRAAVAPSHSYQFAPIWSGPSDSYSYTFRGSPQINLRYGVLATWWLAIGVLTAGGFFAAKTKGEHTKHTNK